MFKRLGRAGQYTFTLLAALPSAPRRNLLRQMMAFSQALPACFDKPLPQMMAHLTPTPRPEPTPANNIRRLADAVAAWHLQSPLGICLRRSLLRYHFLRRAGVPVKIVFGARLKDEAEGGGLGGHAWLTLHNTPYFENPEDYEGFVEMYSYPNSEI